ncbi:hypothetical protein HXX76_004175 [Chlamydomonas incerta]|uniref:Cationic amino acid transporter n=1 Tax=Chlamydomonas incerta TaxID=51695 RepID=A0A835TK88_CHLIN|nr:hypothetical protein HXX76_004175 [Chlamydomonas incerta]|eukprot:KAG2440061.1 hypothetical protein HXX76_004175 [Chlamydomonas incerta]
MVPAAAPAAAAAPAPAAAAGPAPAPAPAAAAGALRRVFRQGDLVMAGLAAIIGAGVFVLTGTAARDFAGPAIIISFITAGVAALASALCYAEFASEVITTGGAASYAEATFGPLAGWLTAANLLLEYVLASAAVAKGFTGYLAALAGLPMDALLLPLRGGGDGTGTSLDLPAAGLLLVLALLVGWGARQSAVFNNAVTAVVLATIALVLAAGFAFVDPHNYSPFTPYGARGVLRGASVVFFAYIGFDMVAVAAEESVAPARDVPCGIIASLLASTGIYVLMATAVTGMVPVERLDESAPFARAYKDAGQGWAQYVIACGAICSVLDTLVITLFSAARLLLLLGRRSVLPGVLAAVHPRSQTPLVATAVVAVLSSVLAAFAPLSTLASLVSLGTLVAFAVVCAAHMLATALDRPESAVAVRSRSSSGEMRPREHARRRALQTPVESYSPASKPAAQKQQQ